jgi:hypothetical protein
MEKYTGNSQTVRWKLIRYEDLLSEKSEAIPEIVNFFGNPGRFTWDDLRALPVYGSSYLSENPDRFKWEVKPRPEEFDPFNRWSYWDTERKQKFKEIAGAELIQLQYVADDDW